MWLFLNHADFFLSFQLWKCVHAKFAEQRMSVMAIFAKAELENLQKL